MLPETDLKMLEIHKLMKLLEQNGISFNSEKLYTGEQIKIPNSQAWDSESDPKRISVICVSGSYGYVKGLLEMWAPGVWEDVIGYLTAEEAFKKIKEVIAK